MKKVISQSMLDDFQRQLTEDEKSKITIQKYMRDIGYFIQFAKEQEIDKSLILAYKTKLEQKYAITSANSMLAALNTFLRFCGWHDLCVKQFRVQKDAYAPEEKELTRNEYLALVQTAEKKHNERISLVIQTICGTGIRVSELKYITVEAIHKGEAVVSCKGKSRRIFLVTVLRKKLLKYAKTRKITTGPVFISKTGKALDRSNIWREMKSLCKEAGVSPQKVFPHNLRHLFARTFYGIEKDIAKLADILGHSNINTTRIYIMTTCREHKRRMEHMKLVI